MMNTKYLNKLQRITQEMCEDTKLERNLMELQSAPIYAIPVDYNIISNKT